MSNASHLYWWYWNGAAVKAPPIPIHLWWGTLYYHSVQLLGILLLLNWETVDSSRWLCTMLKWRSLVVAKWGREGQYLLPRGPNMHWLAVRVGEWFSSMLQRGQLFAWKPTQKCRFVRLMIGSNAKLWIRWRFIYPTDNWCLERKIWTGSLAGWNQHLADEIFQWDEKCRVETLTLPIFFVRIAVMPTGEYYPYPILRTEVCGGCYNMMPATFG